jgi:hypothetical protein
MRSTPWPTWPTRSRRRSTSLKIRATAPMMDFDDRDLVHLAEAADFDRIHLECHIDIEPGSLMRATSLDALLDGAPNPLAPTVREAISAALTGPERDRFLGHLQRAIHNEAAIRRSAAAYLAAYKPRSPSPHDAADDMSSTSAPAQAPIDDTRPLR